MFTRIPINVGEFEAMLAFNKPNYYIEMVVIHTLIFALSVETNGFRVTISLKIYCASFEACNGKSEKESAITRQQR